MVSCTLYLGACTPILYNSSPAALLDEEGTCKIFGHNDQEILICEQESDKICTLDEKINQV